MSDLASNSVNPYGVTPSETSDPLSPENYQELARAQERAKKIRKTAGVARFNGWTTALFALLSVPFAFFSVAGLLVTLGLGVIAWNELRGRSRLLKFDLRAPAFLGWNQLAFLTMIVGYCCWMLYTGLTQPSEIPAEIASNPDVQSALGQFGGIEGLHKLIVMLVYGLVILLSVLFQGMNAWYYFSRRKLLAAYVRDTPQWVIDLQKSTAAE